jgi:hypothetical protein
MIDRGHTALLIAMPLLLLACDLCGWNNTTLTRTDFVAPGLATAYSQRPTPGAIFPGADRLWGSAAHQA